MMRGDSLKNGRQRTNFNGVVLRNYLVVFTVKLSCDSDVRSCLACGLVAQSG
jgi:hypothetical protein